MNNQDDQTQRSTNQQPTGYDPQTGQPLYGSPNGYGAQTQSQYGQPNGYNQQAGQPPYCPPNGQPYACQPPPQQIVYVQQPIAPAKIPASQGEKDAHFSVAGSVMMLILCIIATINLSVILINDVISLNFGALLLFILDILIVVGMWINFANAKKKKLSPTGIMLVKIPYILQFVVACFNFMGNIPVWIFTLNVFSLITGIFAFIFRCITFAFVQKALTIAEDINRDKSVANKKLGVAAAVMMIIFASVSFLHDIAGYLIIEMIKLALSGMGFIGVVLSWFIGGGGVFFIVCSAVSFVFVLFGAVLMISFGKKLKAAHGE